MPMENCTRGVLLNHILELMCVLLTSLPEKLKNEITTGMVLHFQTRNTQKCV